MGPSSTSFDRLPGPSFYSSFNLLGPCITRVNTAITDLPMEDPVAVENLLPFHRTERVVDRMPKVMREEILASNPQP